MILRYVRIAATRCAWYTTFFPYWWPVAGCILTRMDETQATQGDRDIEFVKGCPLCEHTDPELERDLEEFAQLLFDIMLAEQEGKEKQTGDGDG